jgi:IPT/TIG domain/Fibronectin type III domain/Cysteine-rich secretory protein family
MLLGALAIGLLPILSAAAPSPVHLATIPAASSGWLDRLNAWRASAGVSDLTENTTWSAGDVDHATYMVKTGLVTHYEDPTNPYYSTAGDTAARASNIFVSSSTGTSDVQAIDWWMGAPFHAMAMMDPRLTQTGFGSYRDATSSPWQMGAALNVSSGNSFTGGQFPVYFPGNLSTEPLTVYSGNEFPDPTLACPGYSGLPVFVEVGGNVSTTAGPVHTLTANGALLANCVIDSTNPNYANYLTGRGAVIMMPQQPLQNGTTYTVALTVNGVPYTWSFTVGPLSSPCSGAPIVISVNPSSGPMSGGTTVTIGGCRFTGVTAVKFGPTAATSFNFVSDTQITAVSPAQAGGTVNVTVTTPGGTSVIYAADSFTYTSPPGPPTSVTATAGNLSATIAWSQPASDGGSSTTSYTATSSPGGLTSTVSGSTVSTVVSGLTLGSNYTFTVVATNSNGPGAASQPSNQITAVTVPSPPTTVVATAADGSAILRWVAPTSNGGSPVTGYVITPYAGGVAGTPVTFNQPNLMEVVFGLTDGVTYTFAVAAVNAAGAGLASSASNSVVLSSSMRQPAAQVPLSSVPGPRVAPVQSSPAPSPQAR